MSSETSLAGQKLSARSTDANVVRYAAAVLETLEQELVAARLDTKGKVRLVLERVFADPAIAKDYKGAGIRQATMQGRVAKEVLAELGEDPDSINILAIGDVKLPEQFKKIADAILGQSFKAHRNLAETEGFGYDLVSQGSEKARATLIAYLDRYYKFSQIPGLSEKLIQNSCLISGGMRGLDDIATAMEEQGRMQNRRPRFISPDNSFSTWQAIVKKRSAGGILADEHVLKTRPEDRLHLTPDIVNRFYKGQTDTKQYLDTWYITPVGNPSGTKMTPEQLLTTCKAILQGNPEAVLVLDCVYVRTLPVEQARKLITPLLTAPEVLQHVVFLESFSKTHGFCGERVGAFFSSNQELFSGIQNVNRTLSAGNGRSKDALITAITDPGRAEQDKKFEGLYAFWARERQGLYHYLMRFPHLFEPEQKHLQPERLNEPLGLYLFLKLRPSVTDQQVALETGCLGVKTSMGNEKDGVETYMRFSVGTLEKPTYAKYIPEKTGS